MFLVSLGCIQVSDLPFTYDYTKYRIECLEF